MSCYSCGGNPSTFCRECNFPKDTWIAPVDSLPDVFMGDFDHLYRTPDGNLYALSPDRTEWIQVNGSGGKATKYTAGNGIEISDRNVITNTQPNVNQNLSINGRTISITNGNSITLPEDRDTVYNDTELKRRVQAVESKTDNFVSGVNVSREGNKVKLTYTFVNGAPKEVEFEDKDTITLAYDDTALKARVKALEDKPDKDNQTLSLSNRTLTISNGNSVELPDDKDTVYDDAPLKERITALENKEPQRLSFNADTNELSLSNGGDPITLPNNKQKLTKEGNKLILSNGGGEVELPQPNSAVAYDDSDLKRRVGVLEAKPDNDTVYNDTEVKKRLTALEGKTDNFITGVTASRTGNKVKLTYNFVTGQPKEVEFDDKDTIGIAYDDTALRNRVQALEGRQDKDTIYRVTKGKINNNVTSKTNLFNADDVKAGDIIHDVDSTGATPKDVYYKVTSVSGNTVNLEKLGEKNIPVGTTYNDTPLSNRVSALERKADRDNQTLSISGKTVSISGGNSITLPSDKQTISINNNRITLSDNGGSIDLPENGSTFRLAKGDISSGPVGATTTIQKSDLINPDGVKVGDTIQDYWSGDGSSDTEFYKVTSVNGNNITVQSMGSWALRNDKQTISKQGNKIVLSNGGGEVDIPTATPYNDADIKRRLGVLEAKRDNDNQTLSVMGNTISLSGGNSVTIPQSPVHRFYDGDIIGRAKSTTVMTVNKSSFINPDGIKVGDTVEDQYYDQGTINRGIWKVINVSGNNVRVQGIGNYDVIFPKNNQSLTLNGNTLSISGGNSVTLPQPEISGYVSIAQYNELKGALEKILQNLKDSGAWNQTGSNVFQGQFYGNRNIATGNINLFGGTADGDSFIRTNNGRTENDLAGGI